MNPNENLEPKSPTEQNKKMVTEDEILLGFRELDLQLGETLEVHSSLSSMGYVEGGAPTIIEALINTVGNEGTILMSAYPISKPIPLTEEDRRLGIHWKVKKLKDPLAEKTGMGIIVDTFVQRNDIHLGDGTHRVCAWGRNKDNYTKGYAPIYEAKGKVLLLGVGIDRCSSLHLAEDIPLPTEIEELFTISDEILAKYPPSEWSVGGEEPPGDAWGKVLKWAIGRGIVNSVQIGEATCLSFPITPLLDEYRRLRTDEPYELLEIEHV